MQLEITVQVYNFSERARIEKSIAQSKNVLPGLPAMPHFQNTQKLIFVFV